MYSIPRYLLSAILPVILLACCSGCSSVGSLAKTDISRLYSPKYNPPDYSLQSYHLNDSLTSFSIRFPNEKITFSNQGSAAKPVRRIKIALTILDPGSGKLVDSITTFIADSSANVSQYLVHSFVLKVPSGAEYSALSTLSDLAAGKEYILCQPVRKKSRGTSGWYRCVTGSGDPVFDDYIESGSSYRLLTDDTSFHHVYCSAFFHQFTPPLPPFTAKDRDPFDYHVDSAFQLSLKGGESDLFRLGKPGIYFFRSDSMETEGYTLFCVYDGYPRINTTGRMLEPLRYLTSGQEYKQLAESLQPKEAVDNFWLSLSGGADRAVEMIRNYYGRVEDANRFFFSFCEGWKTDRGMIYIIFGPPNVVYRSGQAEFWTYGEVNNYRSMEFVFIKVINPFTGNDYILQRQENYKPYWYNAVQQWRR